MNIELQFEGGVAFCVIFFAADRAWQDRISSVAATTPVGEIVETALFARIFSCASRQSICARTARCRFFWRYSPSFAA
jgi:hypothetical protein